MGSDDAIASGLALRALIEPAGWDAVRTEHGGRVCEVLTFQLQSLLDALPDETVRQARYRERLATLVGLVETAPRPWEGGGSKEPRRPPPMIGHFAPARAMAVSGGATDRYSDDELSPIQRAIEALAEEVSGVAFIIDRHGMLVAAAGDAPVFDTAALAHELARDFSARAGPRSWSAKAIEAMIGRSRWRPVDRSRAPTRRRGFAPTRRASGFAACEGRRA